MVGGGSEPLCQEPSLRICETAVVEVSNPACTHLTRPFSRSWQPLPLQQVPLLRDDQDCAELVRANVVKGDVNPQFQCSHQIESAPDEQSLLSALGSVQAVQRTVVAPLAIVLRRVGAQAGIAQFLPAQRPMHQETERRIIRPLPG